MARAVSVLVCALGLAACQAHACGDLDWSESERRCVCPADRMETDAGTCVPRAVADACTPRDERCDGVDDDCDGIVDEGAARSCAPASQASAMACEDGACVIASCTAGRADCDGDPASGCEVALGTLTHCRSCGETCGWACGEGGCDDAVDLGGGRDHVCVVRGSGHVYCWGANDRGQLGIGSTSAAEDAPRRVVGPSGTGALDDVLRVAGGDGFSCAVRRDGTVWCWGSNSRGQLGNGSHDASDVPVPVAGVQRARDVAAGGSHACAVTTGGELWCWGRNDSGELAFEGTVDQTRAVRAVRVADVVEVGAGFQLTCVRVTDGSVRCFGENGFHGKLGDGSGSRTSVIPVAPAGLPGPAASLAVGDDHACVVIADSGELWCWGSNYGGDFGGPDAGAYPTPIRIDTAGRAARVDSGWRGVCVTLATGRAQCFQDPPASVPEGAAAFATVGAPGTSCAMRERGDLLCWAGPGAEPVAVAAP